MAKNGQEDNVHSCSGKSKPTEHFIDGLHLKEDQNKRKGRIVFCLPSFKEDFFDKEISQVERKVSQSVFVRGLPWHIVVDATIASPKSIRSSKFLDLFVACGDLPYGDNSRRSPSWSCLASVKLRIKAQREGTATDKELAPIIQMFNAYNNNAAYRQLMDFEKLLDPENGWYNDVDDVIVFEAEIEAELPRGVLTLPKQTDLLVNGVRIAVNKELLSAQSSYFKTLFFGDFVEANVNEFQLTIEESSASVRDFERMIAVMYPEMYPEYQPIDGCVGGILHLADQFQIEPIVALCTNFLFAKSKKSALFKYRLAHKYGLVVLKSHVLSNLKKEDFSADKFEENVRECIKMGGTASLDELFARYRELCLPGTGEENVGGAGARNEH